MPDSYDNHYHCDGTVHISEKDHCYNSGVLNKV